MSAEAHQRACPVCGATDGLGRTPTGCPRGREDAHNGMVYRSERAMGFPKRVRHRYVPTVGEDVVIHVPVDPWPLVRRVRGVVRTKRPDGTFTVVDGAGRPHPVRSDGTLMDLGVWVVGLLEHEPG